MKQNYKKEGKGREGEGEGAVREGICEVNY